MKRKILIFSVLAALLMMSVAFIQPVTASSVGDLEIEKPVRENIANINTIFELNRTLDLDIWELIIELIDLLIDILELIKNWVIEHQP